MFNFLLFIYVCILWNVIWYFEEFINIIEEIERKSWGYFEKGNVIGEKIFIDVWGREKRVD